jgi:hypothetical protein
MDNAKKEAFEKAKAKEIDIFAHEAVLIRQLAQTWSFWM